MKGLKNTVAILLGLLLMVFYQNCAEDLQLEDPLAETNESSQSAGTPSVQIFGAGNYEAGSSYQLSALIQNSTNYSLQWFKDSAALSGQTGDSLNLAAIQTADSGDYFVEIQVGNQVYRSNELTVNVTGSTPTTGTGNTFTNPGLTHQGQHYSLVAFAYNGAPLATETVALNFCKAKLGAGATVGSYSLVTPQANVSGFIFYSGTTGCDNYGIYQSGFCLVNGSASAFKFQQLTCQP